VALFVLSGVVSLPFCQQDEKKDADNFGDPVCFCQYTEDVHSKEPNNGRMPMCAVLGVAAADLLIG
jgi:hypothetical protein